MTDKWISPDFTKLNYDEGSGIDARTLKKDKIWVGWDLAKPGSGKTVYPSNKSEGQPE